MVVAPIQRHKSRISRGAFASLGVLFVAFGAVGVVVPGWPTTIFCILALWCFKKSSSRLECWLLNHRLVGATLRDWDENKWISKRVKYIATCSMWAFVLVSTIFIQKWTVRGIVIGLALFGTWYILSRRTKPEAHHSTVL